MLEEEQMRNEIKAIMATYGISDFDIHDKLNPDVKASASRKIAFFLNIHGNYKKHDWEQELNLVELPLLIRFLRTCEGSAIEMKGTITKPQGRQIKGTEVSVKVTNHSFLKWLEMFVNTWLEKEQDGLFQYVFGWKDKEPITWMRTESSGSNTERIEYKDPYFTEDYSDEELEKIIQHYNQESKFIKKSTKNGELGFIASKIIEYVQPLSHEWKQTKLYSFVYDMMLVGKCVGKVAIIEEGFSGDIGREKSQQVRNWIKAYNRDLERL